MINPLEELRRIVRNHFCGTDRKIVSYMYGYTHIYAYTCNFAFYTGAATACRLTDQAPAIP